MVTFSIVMPVYNNEKYFPLAVQSVLEQDFTDFELIIVDDGSTDGTSELADKMMAADNRIRVIHQKNQWIYASFNNGIEKAVGVYIYILNSDDKLMPGALSLMAEKVEDYHPDVIWTKVLMHVCDADQNILVYDKGDFDGLVEDERYFENAEEVRSAWPFFLSAKLAYNQANLYRREIMKGQKFRNDVYASDTLYNISIADKIHSALVMKEPIYSFYIYGEFERNASVEKYYPYVHSMLNEIYEQYLALFQKWGLPQKEYMDILAQRRIAGITTELRGLQAPNCPLGLEDKLHYAFTDCIDEIILQSVSIRNAREELESRILSAVRDMLVSESLPKDSRFYFAHELLSALLCYEKDENDYEKIKCAMNHSLNPHHIGNVFYQKMIQNEKGCRREE